MCRGKKKDLNVPLMYPRLERLFNSPRELNITTCSLGLQIYNHIPHFCILLHGFHAQFENPSKPISVIIIQFGATLHTNTQHLLCSGLQCKIKLCNKRPCHDLNVVQLCL